MPSTFTPIDSAALEAFRKGDEKVLEGLFRDYYEALREEAQAEAGDAHAAPRIVEGAFADAWYERDKFVSPVGLQAFLHQAIHKRAIREKSRHAAVERLKQHEHVHVTGNHHATHVLTVDEAWKQLHGALHAPPVDPAQAAKVRAEIARHDAAAHVQQITKRPPWIVGVVIAAAVAVVLFGVAWYLRTSNRDAEIERAFAAESRELTTNPGERAKVTLLDGTQAELAADSKLTVPSAFERVRAVRLLGAAAFNVTKQGEAPFIVMAGPARVTTTGTRFDVSRLPAMKVITIRVHEGSVDVRAGEHTQSVAAGQVLQVSKDGEMTTPPATSVEEALGWTEGKFAMIDRPVSDVLPMLDRWYRLSVHVGDSSALARKATVRAPLDSPRSALTALEQSAGVVVQWENDVLVLRDSATVKARAAKK